MNQSSKDLLTIFRTTLIKQVLFLLVQQVHMKEKIWKEWGLCKP